MMDEKARRELRAALRRSRRELSEQQQQQAGEALLSLVTAQDFFTRAQRLAFYQKIDGEIDPGPLMAEALAANKDCFLPIINDDNSGYLAFAPYSTETALTENQWGIKEPPLAQATESPTELDVVFVPLVGFDSNCFRLGMGKGFYDRTFGFKIINRHSKPLLVGLAHECQLTAPLPTADWDVRLDMVVTGGKIYRPS